MMRAGILVLGFMAVLSPPMVGFYFMRSDLGQMTATKIVYTLAGLWVLTLVVALIRDIQDLRSR